MTTAIITKNKKGQYVRELYRNKKKIISGSPLDFINGKVYSKDGKLLK